MSKYEGGQYPSIEELIECGHMVRAHDDIVLTCKHMLEDIDLSGVQMVKVARRLKNVLRNRRYWRNIQDFRSGIGLNTEGVKIIEDFDKKVIKRKNKYVRMAKQSLKQL